MPITNPHHKFLLKKIRKKSGPPVHDDYLSRYLGASRSRYPINNPALRKIVAGWMKDNKGLLATEVANTVGSLVRGVTVTEKMMGGFILDRCSAQQRRFEPRVFDRWLDHLQGWAEIDTYCAGKYSAKEVLAQFAVWGPLIRSLSKSKNINKRRASLVLLCAPLRYSDNPRLAKLAFANIRRLSHENSVLITKAVSWLLRSMVKLHRPALEEFSRKHREKLPSIALRETETKLRTGRKTTRRGQ